MNEDQDKSATFSATDLPHQRSSNFTSVYTNTAGFGANFFDMQMIFGQVVPMHSKDERFHPHIEDLVAVTMSWEHAKALVAGLNKAIADYEKDNGPIRAPQKA